MPPKKATKVPERIEEWEKAAAGQDKAIKINASIHEHYKLKSGSDMKEKDFLHLKAIWQAAEETDKWGAHTSLGLGTWFDNAQETLKNCPQFKAYLEAVERQDVPRPSVGMFWAAYEQQYQVSQSLERSPVRKAYEMNEELVNMSLVNFFQAVCACQPGLEINCNPARVHLTFDFRKVKDKKQAKEIDSRIHSLSCETDGLLESRATGRMYAILEAKAQQRAKHEPKVSWQETSEMVTAALSDRGSPKHLHPGR